MGGWGSRVLNFLVKIHIQLFVLQTSSNVEFLYVIKALTHVVSAALSVPTPPPPVPAVQPKRLLRPHVQTEVL